MNVFSACDMCTMRVPGASRGQKGTLNPLEPKLQAVVSFRVGAGHRTQVLWKGSHRATSTHRILKLGSVYKRKK